VSIDKLVRVACRGFVRESLWVRTTPDGTAQSLNVVGFPRSEVRVVRPEGNVRGARVGLGNIINVNPIAGSIEGKGDRIRFADTSSRRSISELTGYKLAIETGTKTRIALLYSDRLLTIIGLDGDTGCLWRNQESPFDLTQSRPGAGCTVGGNSSNSESQVKWRYTAKSIENTEIPTHRVIVPAKSVCGKGLIPEEVSN